MFDANSWSMENILSTIDFQKVPAKQCTKSEYPREPRVFDLKKNPGLYFLSSSVLGVLTLIILAPLTLGNDPSISIKAYLAVIGLTVFSAVMLYYTYSRSFGVDEDKVWTKFRPFFYREVRFDQVDNLSDAGAMLKLSGGGQKLNMQHKRFEYTLACIRLLEELNRRPFALDGVQPTDSRYPSVLDDWRMKLCKVILTEQSYYYHEHPQEWNHLQMVATGESLI